MAEILTNPDLVSIKEELGIDQNSRLLFVSTEGDTDRKTIGILFGTANIQAKNRLFRRNILKRTRAPALFLVQEFSFLLKFTICLSARRKCSI